MTRYEHFRSVLLNKTGKEFDMALATVSSGGGFSDKELCTFWYEAVRLLGGRSEDKDRLNVLHKTLHSRVNTLVNDLYAWGVENNEVRDTMEELFDARGQTKK